MGNRIQIVVSLSSDYSHYLLPSAGTTVPTISAARKSHVRRLHFGQVPLSPLFLLRGNLTFEDSISGRYHCPHYFCCEEITRSKTPFRAGTIVPTISAARKSHVRRLHFGQVPLSPLFLLRGNHTFEDSISGRYHCPHYFCCEEITRSKTPFRAGTIVPTISAARKSHVRRLHFGQVPLSPLFLLRGNHTFEDSISGRYHCPHYFCCEEITRSKTPFRAGTIVPTISAARKSHVRRLHFGQVPLSPLFLLRGNHTFEDSISGRYHCPHYFCCEEITRSKTPFRAGTIVPTISAARKSHVRRLHFGQVPLSPLFLLRGNHTFEDSISGRYHCPHYFCCEEITRSKTQLRKGRRALQSENTSKIYYLILKKNLYYLKTL
uniref:Uncharacterized protein n=1 Tax=Bombyx mori TaxID=7091 RepID=A0A8R2LYG8_BOMMO|nr:uncharacterized protein LOC119629081 [Bombyx mori]